MTLDNLQLHALDLVVEEAIERHDEGDGRGEDMGVGVWKKCCSVCCDDIVLASLSGTGKTRWPETVD